MTTDSSFFSWFLQKILLYLTTTSYPSCLLSAYLLIEIFVRGGGVTIAASLDLRSRCVVCVCVLVWIVANIASEVICRCDARIGSFFQ